MIGSHRPPHLYLVKTPPVDRATRDRFALRQLQTITWFLACAIPLLCALAAFTSPRFRVRSLRVEGAQRLSEAEVRAVGKRFMGRNILLAKTEELARALQKQPAVRAVEIGRWPVWPFAERTALTVRVIERQPVFAVRSRGPVLLCDASGIAFATERKPPAVPVVDLEGVSLRIGATLTRSALDAVSMLLGELTAIGFSEVETILLDRDGFASLTLHDGTAVRLGDEDWSRKIRGLPRALALLRNKGVTVEYIDLTTLRAPAWKPAARKGGNAHKA